MNVTEARRTRHLVIRLDRGDELPGALARALADMEVRAAWITGVGALEAAELAVYDQVGRSYERARRIDTASQLVSLTGNAAIVDGVLALRLSATLAREADAGLEVLAGEIAWARVFSVEVYAVVFEDVSLARSFDERTGLAVLTARAAPSPAGAAAASAPEAREAPRGPAVVAAMMPRPDLGATSGEPPTRLHRPARFGDDVEVYPEIGDSVNHFHFGECTVITSDGDRIRLRQERDGRVREVALTMLRIESPTTTADGRRHFHLARKN